MTPLNVAIYVRVSTQEQKLHGISVDAQEAACRAWVAEHGHRLTGVYNDAGLSARAKYTKRREMLRLLEDVQAGKIDLIIFAKLDRWFRNVADYYEVQSILEAHGVKWRAIQEDYETETASGRFKVNIMLAVAQDEADRTSERIKAAAEYKRKNGEAVGRFAVGYKIEGKHWVIDEETRPAVATFFNTYYDTFSTKQAMIAAAEKGLKLNMTHAGRMLRNPTYYGDAFGVPCPAYITKEQFDSRRVGTRARVNKSGRVYLFSGLLRCGYCGGSMTSGYNPKGRGLKYYHCDNHARYLERCPCGCHTNERKLEAFLVENLADIAAGHNAAAQKAKKKDHTADIQRSKAKLERLKELYIDGEIDRTAYDVRADTLRADIKKWETDIPDLKPVELPKEWAALYTAMTEGGKKLFWKKTLKKITVYKDKDPDIYF